MSLFSFSCFKSYYYFVISWFLDLSITFIRDLYLENEIKSVDYMKGTEFIYISCLNLDDLLAGFFVLYTFIKMYSIKQDNTQIENSRDSKKNSKKVISYELIYNKASVKNHKFIYLFLISLLEFVARSTDLLYLLIIGKIPIRIGQVNWLISIDIFSRIIISRIILKTKIYRHHILSIILTIIGLSTMSICAFKAIIKEELDNWPYFLFIIGKYILLPLEDVINKVLLTDEFLLTHYLMFYRGIFNFIMLGILSGSVFLTRPESVNFSYFEQFKTDQEIKIQILLKVIFTILSFFKAFCLLRVIDIFSPQHVSFLNTTFSLFQLFKCRSKSNDDKKITAFDAIFLLIIILGTLIFNEIIILNFFGLNKNTKKNYIIKEELESKELNKTFSEEESNDLSINDNKEKLNATGDENCDINESDF
jgi:hypothetical protein